jgi:murein DD-endopeptidase MepM/ murein hydrolase activator NlpD
MSRHICRTPRELCLALFAAWCFGACGSPPSTPSSASEEPFGTEAFRLSKNLRSPESVKPAPEKDKRETPPPPALDEPWSYVMLVDHGVRSDDGGEGAFLAPRYHGLHNGLDLLAPLGTPVQAPCNGKARAGSSGSFGRFVQVVCKLPAELTRGRAAYASLFYSHLSRTSPSKRDFESVRRGQSVGAVGKTGNAAGSEIAPHLHLEIVVHDDEQAALDESHSGRDQTSSRAADVFAAALERECLQPNGFEIKSGTLARARRIDPFVVLVCLAPDKPAFSLPRAPLDAAAQRWSEHYRAKTFDVNVGRRLPTSEAQATARR